MENCPSDALPGYRRYLQALCYAATTIRRYTTEARAFAERARTPEGINLRGMRPADLEAWLKALMESGSRSLSTVVSRMRSLRPFFTYLVESERLDRDLLLPVIVS